MPISLICAICSRAYNRRPSRAADSNYCSRSCRSKGISYQHRQPLDLVNLAGGQVGLQTTSGSMVLISPEDSDLARFRWYGSGVYTSTVIDGRSSYLHRVIAKRIEGRKLVRTDYVDHINRNVLDCRRSNLRVVTPAENTLNRKFSSTKQSIFKGVAPTTCRWSATIGFQGASYYLGVFDSEAEAANMYDQYAVQLHGDFASLNFDYF